VEYKGRLLRPSLVLVDGKRVAKWRQADTDALIRAGGDEIPNGQTFDVDVSDGPGVRAMNLQVWWLRGKVGNVLLSIDDRVLYEE